MDSGVDVSDITDDITDDAVNLTSGVLIYYIMFTRS